MSDKIDEETMLELPQITKPELPSEWSTRHGIDAIYGHLHSQVYDYIYENKELSDRELITSLIQNYPVELAELKAIVLRDGEVEVDGLTLLNETLASEDLLKSTAERFRSMAHMDWKVKHNDFLSVEDRKGINEEA